MKKKKSMPELPEGDEGITLSELNAEITSVLKNGPSFVSESWKQARESILEEVTPADFAYEAGGGARVTAKDQTVIVVRLLLRLMGELGHGLCRIARTTHGFFGQFWTPIDAENLPSFFGDVAIRMGVPRVVAEHHLFRDGLVRQFETIASIATPVAPLGTLLINFKNGTLEVTDGNRILRPFHRKDYLTYQLPFDYDPNATCPQWIAFLDQMLPDKSCQDVLAEGFAQAFLDLKLEKVIMLHGSGSNGKSVIFDVVQYVFGTENISNYSLKNLSHPYYRARIANKLINFSSEISAGIDPDEFKKLASGEPIDARNPYEPPFIIRRYARLIFNCNELPRDVEHTEAFFRRLLIIPFTVTIKEQDQDRDLAKKIAADELPGIFNWIMAALDTLVNNKAFSQCKAAEEAIRVYKIESDSVAIFVEENRYKSSNREEDTMKLIDLHSYYRVFCTDNLYRPVSSRTMRKRLTGLGFETRRTNVGVIVYAIHLPDEEEVMF